MTAPDRAVDGRYRNEATACAARPDVEFQVQVRHADAGTFAEAKAWNEHVRGMVGVAVENSRGEVLFIRHEDYGGWVTPGGRVERGESFRRAAVREVREESGVECRLRRPLLVSHFVTRHAGESTDSFFALFAADAVDPEPADDPGVEGETITDVRWSSRVPDGLPDDVFVRETVALLVDRLDGLETG